jgi:hypothetical protein
MPVFRLHCITVAFAILMSLFRKISTGTLVKKHENQLRERQTESYVVSRRWHGHPGHEGFSVSAFSSAGPPCAGEARATSEQQATNYERRISL